MASSRLYEGTKKERPRKHMVGNLVVDTGAMTGLSGDASLHHLTWHATSKTGFRHARYVHIHVPAGVLPQTRSTHTTHPGPRDTTRTIIHSPFKHSRYIMQDVRLYRSAI